MRAPKSRDYYFSWQALHHPESFPVFGIDEELPAAFENHQSALSLINAWWLSKASHLAYCSHALIDQQLHRVNLELYGFYSAAGSQAFIATGDGYAWLSFRGSTPSERSNLKNDMDIRPVSLGENVFVHEGFLRSLDAIWPDIEAALHRLIGEGYNLQFTGHSLGAAMATLAASRISPAALYTFGSPRVGNRAFLSRLKPVPVYRWVNCCDVVTALPMASLGYQHAGEALFMSADHQLIRQPAALTRWRKRLRGYVRFYQRLPWFIPGAVKLRSLSDHIILNYSRELGIYNRRHSGKPLRNQI